jgi:SAM-dependent methyltransferase
LNHKFTDCLAEQNGLRVAFCSTCGYAHLDPLPDPAALAAYYSADFWRTKGAGWLATYEAQRDWITAKNGDVLSVLVDHAPGRKLLDVGAGYGFFVADAVAAGWQAVGIDPSVEAAAYARRAGLDVRAEAWEDFWPSRYDAITAFWLLEHLPDAFDFLRWCRRHLNDGGVVCLAVPNEWTQEMVEASNVATIRDWWVHPTHCNYFTGPMLSNLLGRAGFRVVDALTTFPIARFISEGKRDYTADAAVGADCHEIIRSAELHTPQGKRIEEARNRARQNVGRDLIVFATVEG